MKATPDPSPQTALPAILLPLILLLLATLACAFVEEILEPEATFLPPPTIAIDQSPAATSAAGGTAAGPTPTLAVAPTVTTPATAADLGPPPGDLDGLANWLGQAHAVGIDVSELCAILGENEWRRAEDDCRAADLDDDDAEEWFLTLDTTRLQPAEGPGAPLEGHPGDLWVVSDGAVVYRTHDSEEPDFLATAPALVELVDMTGDEQPEAITVSSTCGAHTCFNYYQVISAHDGEIRNVVDPAEEQEVAAGDNVPVAISLSYVDEERVEDATGDDLPDLVISGGLVGSAGAGIQRARTEVWAWDGDAVSLYEQLWEDTGYRFHRLYNANYAFEQESYGVAAELYESVITDPALEEVEWHSGSEEEIRSYVQQFAGFRLAMLPLLRGDITEATRWRNWLQESHPQTPITRAATLLISEWEANGNDLPAACNVVTSFLEGEPNPTGPLTDMGYNNPSLEAGDVCAPAGSGE